MTAVYQDMSADAVFYPDKMKGNFTYLKDISDFGWIPLPNGTYVSGNSLKIAGVDVRSLVELGAKIRFKQSGSWRYGYCSVAPTFNTDTTFIISGNSVLNEAITEICFSNIAKPFGFPRSFLWSSEANPQGFEAGVSTSAHFSLGSNTCHLKVSISGISNGTVFTFNVPIAAAHSFGQIVRIQDNSGSLTTGLLRIPSGSNIATVYKTVAGDATWTATGSKKIDDIQFDYFY